MSADLDATLARALVAAIANDTEALDALQELLARRELGPAAPVGYSVERLATELGISQRAIRGAIERRELPAVKRGKRWLISRESVEAWLAPQPMTTRPEARMPARHSSKPSAMADLIGTASGARRSRTRLESDRTTKRGRAVGPADPMAPKE